MLAVLSLSFVVLSPSVQAAQTPEELMLEQGFTLIALRNDAIDSNQDGDVDAIRVVVIVNSTSTSNALIVKLRGLHKEREVILTKEIQFENQTNISLVYDAWSSGEHELRLDFVDQNGAFIASYPLPTFTLQPALRTPHVVLALDGASKINTGESCFITREFVDETGPHYGEDGVRTLTGAPFRVYDDDSVIDCSAWPAGTYSIKETYRNGLGQTAASTLNFTIANRPAPSFTLNQRGHLNTTSMPCEVKAVLSDVTSTMNNLTFTWRVKGDIIDANSAVYDCAGLGPGAYLITLEMSNEKQSTSIAGFTMVRLPSQSDAQDANVTLPSTSLGQDTPTKSVGWMSMGLLGLAVMLFVFLSVVRPTKIDEDQLFETTRQRDVNEDGSPRTDGLPTTVDDQGMLWRQHPDGQLDWWDHEWEIWHRWDQ